VRPLLAFSGMAWIGVTLLFHQSISQLVSGVPSDPDEALSPQEHATVRRRLRIFLVVSVALGIAMLVAAVVVS